MLYNHCTVTEAAGTRTVGGLHFGTTGRRCGLRSHGAIILVAREARGSFLGQIDCKKPRNLLTLYGD
jgi:hypothetical protein